MKKIIIVVIVISIVLVFITFHFKKKTMQQGIQQSTYDLVRRFEGERTKSYKDSVGIDTIGIGHRILPTEGYLINTPITYKTSYELFKHDAGLAANNILTHIKFPLTQNQLDALVSLVFNIGVGAFNSSTVLKEINNFFPDGFDDTEKENIKNAWMSWKNAGGKPILENRRKQEFELFFS